MKKYLPIILSIFTLTSIAQQLPNASFEAWSLTGNDEKPDDWNQLNESLPDAVAAFVPKTCYKETNPHTGTYCVKLETVNVSFQGPVNGILTTGDIITSPPYGVNGGLPYPYRPDSLVGWYKSAPASGDLCTIEITLLDVNADTVGRGKFYTPATAVTTWTRFAVAIVYNNAQVPDKAITLASSSDGFNAVVGSLLWVDDFSLVFNPVSIEENVNSLVKVFSNNGILYVDLSETELENPILYLYALDGKLVASRNLQNNSMNEINLGLTEGVYLYSIQNDAKSIQGKISIR